jgi:hypothetical protein
MMTIGRRWNVEAKITILQVIDSDRRRVLSTLVTQEGLKQERWGVCRERAESVRPFVGKSMTRRQFDELLLERLEMS